MRSSLMFVVAGFAVIGAGCSSGKPSDPQEAQVDLASDTVTIEDEPIYDANMASTNRMSVDDVTRDGRSIVMILESHANSATIITTDPGCPECPATVGSAGGGSSLTLKVSEDLGVTWKALPIPWATWQGQYGPIGVHASGGRLIVLGSGSTTGIGDAQYYYTTLRELDVTTGHYVANPTIDMQKWYQANFRARGSKLVNVDSSVSGNPNDSFDSIISYDLSTRKLDTTRVQLPVKFLSSVAYGSGSSWILSGTDQLSAALPVLATNETCLVTVDLTGALVSSTCTPMSTWPKSDGHTLQMARGPTLIGTDGANVVAVWPNSALHTTSTLTLGSGAAPNRITEAPTSPGLLIHPNFDTYVGMASGLADVPATGQGRLLGMPSPCKDDHCGVAVRLVNLTPLDGGQYLGIWIVNSRLPDTSINGGTAYHQHIYARPVTLSMASSLGDPKTTSLASANGASPAGPVQTACVAASGCYPNVDIQGACMDYWSALPDNNPGRIAFIAAANQGCPALIDAYPDAALWLRGMACHMACYDAHTAISCIYQGAMPVS
jgi:hypothetical protein